MMQDSSVKTNENIASSDKTAFFTSAMKHNIRMNLKSNVKIIIVHSVLCLLGLPMFFGIELMAPSYWTKHAMELNVASYGGIALCAGVASIAMGILFAILTMPYLWNKTTVDMRMSLPMTRAQRFVSDVLSGLIMYIIPFLAAQVITVIIQLIGYNFVDGYYEADFSGFRTAGMEFDFYHTAAPILPKVLIAIPAVMLMFYVLAVLVISCCGSLDGVGYIVLLNGLIPGTALAFIAAVCNAATGLDEFFYVLNVIPYTSPIGGAVLLALGLDEGYGGTMAYDSFWKWLVCYLLLTVLIGIGAFLIYRRRKAEDTGKPVVFAVFHYIIMALGLFVLSFLFLVGGDDEMVVPMFMVTAIIYFILTIIRNRGFSHILKATGFYVITMAVSIGLYALIGVTSAFGADEYIPDEKMIKGVYISYDGYFSTAEMYSAYTGILSPSKYGEWAYITDKDAVKIVTDVHRNVAGRSEPTDGNNIMFCYKLKDGRTVFRSYSLTASAYETLSQLDMTDKFKEYRAKAAGDMLKRSIPDYYPFFDSKDTPQLLQLKARYAMNTYSGSVSSVPISKLPSGFREKLAECYSADILEETAEQYFANKDEYYLISVNYWSPDYMVKKNYKRTIEYLLSCGFTLPEFDKNVSDLIYHNYSDLIVSNKVMDAVAGYDTVATSASGIGHGNILLAGEENDVYYVNFEFFSDLHNVSQDDLYELLSIAQKQYKGGNDCYTIIVDGKCAVIPEEYSDIAENIFIRAASMTFVNNILRTGSVNSEGNAYYDDRAVEEFNFNTDDYARFLRAFITAYGAEKIDSVCGSDISSQIISFCDSYPVK